MSYTAEISRNNPTAFLFLVDLSGSMSESLGDGPVKSECVANVMNRTLMNLIVRSTKAEGTRNY